MKISKARLRQIINEEVQNYKRNLQEGNAVSRAITQIEKTIGFAIAADKELDFKAQPDVAKNLHRIIRSLEDLHNKMHDFLETGDANYLGEEMPVRTTHSSDPELDQIVDIARTVAERGGGLFDIKQPLEAEGFDVDATSRFTIINTSNGKIAIASVNNVELSGDEELIDTQHGQLAVGRI